MVNKTFINHFIQCLYAGIKVSPTKGQHKLKDHLPLPEEES